MDKVTENVYTGFNFRGCNCSFVVTSDGVVLIDTPMVPSEAKNWREEASKHGEIRYVINNEPHNDHVAGNCWMGSTLVAHEGTREAIKHNDQQALEGQMKWMAPDALPLGKDFHYRLPDITFSDELTLYLGKHTFHLISVPGHTPSETAVYVPEERVVFVSDNVIMGMPIMINAVPDIWLVSLKKLMELDVDKVVPGHGPLCEKKQLQVMYDNVKYIADAVRDAIAKGWSLKEIQEKLTLEERFPPMGPPGAPNPMATIRTESYVHLYEVLKK
ncbi:MAG: MBL fold metallo-hydrolase [Dehalococcoidales bacterium]|nr:MBL fold metallo-hydrolase [Dehalococcoidales bacterium]